MAKTKYVALLRGINVGGGNIIKMADLRACFEASKLEKVVTYIQSGNVLFESNESDNDKLTRKLEAALSKTFSPYEARVVLRSHGELKEIVRKAPKGFGKKPQEYRYDVIFLKEPLTASQAMKHVTTKEGVDEVFPGPRVLYFSRLVASASQSRMGRIVGTPIYPNITIRNWNTTNKLLTMMDG